MLTFYATHMILKCKVANTICYTVPPDRRKGGGLTASSPTPKIVPTRLYQMTVCNVGNFLFNRKEGNVLLNDALNTFYLRLYGVGHMVKDHSDSERGNPPPPHELLQLTSRVLYMHHPTDRIAHTTAFGTPVVEHWVDREIAQWVHHEGSIR